MPLTMTKQCDGTCHDGKVDLGDCEACGSLEFGRMCDDCTFYATH